MENGQDRRQLQFWLGMFISAASLAAIFLLIDPAEVLAALRSARYGYLILSALGVVAFLMLRAVRWRFMLGNQIAWRQVFHIQNIGYMLTSILPFRIGDVARAVLIGNVPPVTFPQGLSTMVVERVLDLLFIVTLLPFTLAEVGTLPENVQTVARFAGVLAVAAIVTLVVAANQRPLARRLVTFVLDRIYFLDTAAWVRRLDELLSGLSSLTRLGDGLLLGALSVLVWVPILFAYHAGLLAVNLRPTPAMTAFVVCAAALSVTAPSSPGQVGVFHAAVIFALVQILGQPDGPSVSFAFLYHALNILIMLLLGVIGVYRIGATLRNVIATTQSLMKRKQ